MQGLGELTDLELEKKINAEPKDTISKKFGWDCDIMHPEAMVEAPESVLARMDKLAEVFDVRENELYEADRTRILNMAKDLKEGDTVADLSARLTEFRTRLMFAPLRFYEGNREMLKKVAANIVDSYGIEGDARAYRR